VPRAIITDYIKSITHVAEHLSAVTPAIAVQVVDFIQRLISTNDNEHMAVRAH
jgi:hypothetical protein